LSKDLYFLREAVSALRLANQVAVVTGGGSGIGEAISRRFDAEGARIAVLDIREAAAEAVTSTLGNESVALAVDVRRSDEVDEAVDAIAKRFGQIDILVNNAGIAGGEEAARSGERLAERVREAAAGRVAPPMEATVGISDEQFRVMVETHLYGTFYCTRAALRHMTVQGSGAIVNIGSRCGQEGCMMLPHYSAAKGAIHAFTRAVAQDVAAQGIRVNAVAPGFVDTPINDFLPEEAINSAVAATPAERMGTSAEVAAVTLFLASDDASFMYGQVLGPNGGLNTSPV
jgi:3-oxoacyl-[acyl-carrier protein] reductase